MQKGYDLHFSIAQIRKWLIMLSKQESKEDVQGTGSDLP